MQHLISDCNGSPAHDAVSIHMFVLSRLATQMVLYTAVHARGDSLLASTSAL